MIHFRGQTKAHFSGGSNRWVGGNVHRWKTKSTLVCEHNTSRVNNTLRWTHWSTEPLSRVTACCSSAVNFFLTICWFKFCIFKFWHLHSKITNCRALYCNFFSNIIVPCYDIVFTRANNILKLRNTIVLCQTFFITYFKTLLWYATSSLLVLFIAEKKCCKFVLIYYFPITSSLHTSITNLRTFVLWYTGQKM